MKIGRLQKNFNLFQIDFEKIEKSKVFVFKISEFKRQFWYTDLIEIKIHYNQNSSFEKFKLNVKSFKNQFDVKAYNFI